MRTRHLDPSGAVPYSEFEKALAEDRLADVTIRTEKSRVG